MASLYSCLCWRDFYDPLNNLNRLERSYLDPIARYGTRVTQWKCWVYKALGSPTTVASLCGVILLRLLSIGISA